MFVKPPDRIQRPDVVIMQQTIADDLAHIMQLWLRAAATDIDQSGPLVYRRHNEIGLRAPIVDH
jgi:hypothetical protein